MHRSTSPSKPSRTHGHKRTLTSNNYQQSSPAPTTPVRNLSFDQFSQTCSANQDNLDQIHISPTKALALSRLQHDIFQIQSWLESLFSPARVPPHLLRWRDEVLAESSASVDGVLVSNDNQSGGTVGSAINGVGVGGNQVLEALKVLKQANLAADHLNLLVHEAVLEELVWTEQRRGFACEQQSRAAPAQVVMDELRARLSGEARTALEALSRSATALGISLEGSDENCSINLVNTFAGKILKQAHQHLTLNQQVRMLQKLTLMINADIQPEPEVPSDFDADGVRQDSIQQSHARSTQFNRDTKQINLKIMEYEDRVKGLQRQLSNLRVNSSNLEDVLVAGREVEQRKLRVKDLQTRIAAFEGLPPDIEASRGEVRRSMIELEELKRKREKLFERMGTG